MLPILVGASLAFLAVGCRSPKPVTLTLIPKGIEGDAVRVEVVAVSAGALPVWQNYKISDYWRSDDDLRKVTTCKKSFEMTTQRILPKDDALWAQWMKQKATHLIILSDPPGARSTDNTPADTRRLVIETKNVDKDKVQVEVTRAGLIPGYILK